MTGFETQSEVLHFKMVNSDSLLEPVSFPSSFLSSLDIVTRMTIFKVADLVVHECQPAINIA